RQARHLLELTRCSGLRVAHLRSPVRQPRVLDRGYATVGGELGPTPPTKARRATAPPNRAGPTHGTAPPHARQSSRNPVPAGRTRLDDTNDLKLLVRRANP